MIRLINKYEKIINDKEKYSEEWLTHPQPDLQYRYYHLHLAKVCERIEEKLSRRKIK